MSGLINSLLDKNSISIKNILNVNYLTTGFDNQNDVEIVGDSSLRRIILGGTWTAYFKGLKVNELTAGWVSPAHGTNTNEVYFLIYDGISIDWHEVSTLNYDYYKYLLIALAFYNSSSAKWVYQRECHGAVQSWASHQQEHYNTGTFKISGGTLSNYVLNSTTPANRRPSISQCLIQDEDLQTTLSSITGNYTQYRLDGPAEYAYFIPNSTDIISLSGNQPYYNQYTGGSWVQTLMSVGNYTSIWVLAIPMANDSESQKLKFLFIQGQTQNSNLDDEEALTTNNINLGQLNDLTPESVFLARIIIRYIGGNWEFIQVDALTGSRRTQISSPTGNYLSSVSINSTLTGLGTPSSVLGVNLTNPNLWTGLQTTYSNLSNQTDSYTLVLSDASKVIEINAATAKNLTVPLNSSVLFPIGTMIGIIQQGVGQITIVPSGGVTINSSRSLKLRTKNSFALLIKRATDEWYVIGDIE